MKKARISTIMKQSKYQLEIFVVVSLVLITLFTLLYPPDFLPSGGSNVERTFVALVLFH